MIRTASLPSAATQTCVTTTPTLIARASMTWVMEATGRILTAKVATAPTSPMARIPSSKHSTIKSGIEIWLTKFNRSSRWTSMATRFKTTSSLGSSQSTLTATIMEIRTSFSLIISEARWLKHLTWTITLWAATTICSQCTWWRVKLGNIR